MFPSSGNAYDKKYIMTTKDDIKNYNCEKWLIKLSESPKKGGGGGVVELGVINFLKIFNQTQKEE